MAFSGTASENILKQPYTSILNNFHSCPLSKVLEIFGWKKNFSIYIIKQGCKANRVSLPIATDGDATDEDATDEDAMDEYAMDEE